jgi:hypothetical protein
MALDFLNSLKVEEQPLMSISEMGNASTQEHQEQPDEGNADEPKVITDTADSSGLLPISNMVNQDDEPEPNNKAQRADKPEPNSAASSSSKKYAAIIKALHEKTGAFEGFNEEEFEDTPESFLEYLDGYATKNAENLANSYINHNLTPLQQKFVSLVEDGLSEENAAEIVKGYKLSDNITEDILIEDPDKAKKLYAEYLRFTTAFSEDRIKKEIQEKEDAGTLIDKALDIIPEFKGLLAEQEEEYKKEVKQTIQQQQQFQQRLAEDLNNYLQATEEIGGIKLNKTLKNKWINEYGLVEVNGKKVNPVLATREADPNKFDALLRLYHAMGLFKYDAKKQDFVPDFSVIKTTSKNETITNLQKAVEFENEKRRTSSYGSNDTYDFDVEKEDHKKRWAELAKKLKTI